MRSPPFVLIAEDDRALAELLVRTTAQGGFTAECVDSIAGAMARIERQEVDVLVADLHLLDGDGVELIERTRRTDPRIAIVAITGFGSIDAAVRAVRQGAYEFLTKPVEPAALTVAITRAMEARTLRGEVERLRSALQARSIERRIVGRSRAMEDVIELTGRAARSDANVLITGPSGSGKELVARALHEGSARKDGPFIPINAAAISDNLIESELFGHVRGAFTDARADRRGLFQEARGGTLFLDEIGDLPLHLQPKLLRALQEREVRPVGGSSAQPIDVRVLAATHQDLQGAIREKRFREDLYYRLAVIEITVPPLAHRPEDILPLMEHFLERAAARSGRPIKGFSAVAARQLTAYRWPGNVRELENAVERAVALARDEWIGVDDLPRALSPRMEADLFANAAERMMTLEELEREYVVHVLGRYGGNKKRAAAALGVNRRTIQRWLGASQEEPEPGDKG